MNRRRLAICFISSVVILWLAASLVSHPKADIRVVDAAGRPVVGAVIKGEGLGTKPGPTAYGWGPNEGWGPALDSPTVKAIITDANGSAQVRYPAHLSKGIETDTIKLLVDHADFVPNHSERVVAMTCPRALSWKPWANYFAWRFGRKDPIVLQKGAILCVRVRKDLPGPGDVPLYVQVGDWEREATNVWTRPEPGVALTGRLPPGPHLVRAVAFDGTGRAWFSEQVAINAAANATNQLSLALNRGATVRGRLDDTVPRPVRNGRLTVDVWPNGTQPGDSPPQWHSWANIRSDGTFEIGSLPPGRVEIFALCQGRTSINGKGEFAALRYPQRFKLETNDISVTLAMEPTASLEVKVSDRHGKPLKNAKVSASPTIAYSVVGNGLLGRDCYRTADFIRDGWRGWAKGEALAFAALASYNATTDERGLALIQNLPLDLPWLYVERGSDTSARIMVNGKELHNTARLDQIIPVTMVPNGTNHADVDFAPADE